MSDYYTHREYLKEELNKINKTKKTYCLEFGTGEGSGLIFNEFAKIAKNTTIKAYDSDLNWLTQTSNKYSLNNYTFSHVNNWDEFLNNTSFEYIYDLVFVDQAPWEARIKSIDTIKEKSKIIILHDFDYFNINVTNDIYSVSEGSFFHTKYGNDFELIVKKDLLPPTLIMVNKKLR